jgi:hypothetical protein
MSIQVQKQEHSPTLNTILMVEQTLKNMKDSAVTLAELKKILPRQVNHNTLVTIIDYLDKSNKVYIGTKGITWIYNTNPNFRRLLKTALEV